ncbi:unnamed protein product [Adineta steineri]|uniref:HpcH/HpaI aldolase/citrate lyase domain-containing protein n=1 Tax=Adineta steineri TaxID=433720 RepID=A0A814UQ50_9BILA|nr:unnamed protein product [Adineta steineri]
MEKGSWDKYRMLLLLVTAYVVMCITVIIGFTGQFFYWLIFDVCNFNKEGSNRKLNVTKSSKPNEYYTLIVGSGFSGLGVAIKLRELGTDNFIIIERNAHIGGTWYANTYPGCTCDVPSNLYSFSFEPNPNWSHFFGRQPEIGQYLEHCTDKYDIRRHIKFSTTVTKMKWLDDKQLWEVTTQSNGEENHIYAKFIMSCHGPLSNASFPKDIPVIYCESARSLADLRSILTTASSLFSLQGVVFGSDDFSADVGINGRYSPEAFELTYARQKIITTCRLFENAQPIDMVYINFKDLDGLKKQSEQGAAWGFTGKQVIHPQQVPIVQAAFSPSVSSIAWAKELIEAYDKHEKEEGKGAFTFRGQTMVDKPLLRKARSILNMTR